MPTDKSKTAPKTTLMAKESREYNLDPRIYFMEIIERNDVFATIFEKIIQTHDKGEDVYYTNTMGQTKKINGCLVIQDRHGASYVCPVVIDDDGVIEQQIRALTIDDQENQSLILEEKSFGTLAMGVDEYIDVCSRGFENASRTMLGLQRARLLTDYTLVATFYWHTNA